MDARLLALALVALTACRAGSSPVPEARADEPVAPPVVGAVAVVELFTSEGCSSCPAADVVLADLARGGERGVYVLAFHVDYWDELGWVDGFASPANTARQRAYARAFGMRGVYTPQMVVGGTEQFTGSDRGHADAAIARALARPAVVALSVKVRRTGANALAVDYEARGAPAGSVLNVATVQRGASSVVGAGENAGRTLQHANVVRAFVTVPLGTAAGTVRVPLPATLNQRDADVIAYVQRAPGEPGEPGGMAILGAARAPLEP